MPIIALIQEQQTSCKSSASLAYKGLNVVFHHVCVCVCIGGVVQEGTGNIWLAKGTPGEHEKCRYLRSMRKTDITSSGAKAGRRLHGCASGCGGTSYCTSLQQPLLVPAQVPLALTLPRLPTACPACDATVDGGRVPGQTGGHTAQLP